MNVFILVILYFRNINQRFLLYELIFLIVLKAKLHYNSACLTIYSWLKIWFSLLKSKEGGIALFFFYFMATFNIHICLKFLRKTSFPNGILSYYIRISIWIGFIFIGFHYWQFHPCFVSFNVCYNNQTDFVFINLLMFFCSSLL